MKFVLPAFLLLLAAAAGTPQGMNPEKIPDRVAIFAVARVDNVVSIDPVVIVNYGANAVPALDAPIPESNRTAPDFDRLETAFYKPGSLVTLFSGGEKVGTAKVRKSNVEGRDGGCIDLSANIAVQPGLVRSPILAANTSTEIHGHTATRRAATPLEAATLRALAAVWLAEHGLDPQAIRGGEVGPVVATELRPGKGRALIGRFDVRTANAIHQLFVIAEQDAGAYRLTLANLELQHDVDEGSDKIDREYIDQLDINNDGQDEVITRSTHYESFDYAVWELDKTKRAWRMAFSGGGGGC